MNTEGFKYPTHWEDDWEELKSAIRESGWGFIKALGDAPIMLYPKEIKDMHGNVLGFHPNIANDVLSELEIQIDGPTQWSIEKFHSQLVSDIGHILHRELKGKAAKPAQAGDTRWVPEVGTYMWIPNHPNTKTGYWRHAPALTVEEIDARADWHKRSEAAHCETKEAYSHTSDLVRQEQRRVRRQAAKVARAATAALAGG